MTPDYQIIPTSEGFALQYHTPLPKPFDWVTLYEAPTAELCTKACDMLSDGETPPDWETLQAQDEVRALSAELRALGGKVVTR